MRSVVLSPTFDTDHTLFTSTASGIEVSHDSGGTWRGIGPDGISLLSISPDFAHDGTLFAGTEHGLYVTRNAGTSWLSIAGPLSSTSVVAALALSPAFHADGRVLVSIAGRGLFGSTDGGRTFTAVGASLLARGLVIGDFENPTSEPIQFSPDFATDRTVFAYAQQSVVRSTDGGNSWAVLDIPPAKDFVAPKLPAGPSGSAKTNGIPVALIALAAAVVLAGATYFGLRRAQHGRGTGPRPAMDAPTPERDPDSPTSPPG